MCQSSDNEKRNERKDDDMQQKVIHAEDLFQGEREVQIEHEGEFYRLRITRRNKLILQK